MCLAIVIAVVFGFASSARANFQAGLDAAMRGDYATAFNEWKPLADLGNARLRGVFVTNMNRCNGAK